MKRNHATRWLILPLGLVLAVAAGYAVLMGWAPRTGEVVSDAEAQEAQEVQEAQLGQPVDLASSHPVIREGSRERLREILREAGSEPRQ